MKHFTSSRLFALAILCGSVTVAKGQINDYDGGYGYTGSIARDLAFGPEWRSYQALTRPTGGHVSRPVATNTAATIPSAPLATPPVAPLPKQTDYALRFFGGESARRTLQQMPQRPASSSQSRPLATGVARGQKPFKHASSGQTISPYLNLDRPETSEELPNYFTFVRPQNEQNEVNRRQQRELVKLERQVQTATFGNAAARSAAPGTGHSTRFGDTGRYYGGWRR